MVQLGNTQISNLIWAKQQGGTSTDDIKAIAVDQSGNVFTGGNFASTADFDPSSAVYNLTSSGSWEGFVSKLDVNGDFQWAIKIGSTLADYVYDIATDNTGNVYVSGGFQGTVDFDPSASVVSLTSVASQDGYIAKYSPTGSLVWVKQIGGTSQIDLFTLTVDAANNVFVAGSFYGQVDFDPGVGTYTLDAFGAYHGFVLKLDSNGDFVWAKQLKGDTEISVLDIELDNDGNVFVVGEFIDEVDFDPGAANFFMTSSVVGIRDAFILKLDNLGGFVWAKQLGGTDLVSALSISINASNQLFIAGGFKGTIDFDPNAGTNNLTSAGMDDAYVAKFDNNGSLIWVNQMSGTSRSAARSVFVSNEDEVYVTGYFENTLELAVDETPPTLTSNGGNDIFIVKYNENGFFIDGISIGSTGSDLGYEIYVSNSGHIYLGGYFENTVDFDPSSGTTAFTSFGSHDGYVIKLGDCNSYTTDTHISCDSLVWINGITYTSSNNSAIYIMGNAAGCDSIITLDLTILHSVNHSETVTACGSAIINGTIYTNSQTVVDIYAGQAANSCDSIVTTTLVINDLPDVTTTVSGLTITANLSGANYQWIDCGNNNQPIVGETNATFTATANGSYAVIVTDANCSDTSTCMVINTVGLTKQALELVGVSIFPNPTNGKITVEIADANKEAYTITLLDALGREITTKNTMTNSISLDLSEYQKGVYFVCVSNDSNQTTYRVVKQ